MSEGLHAPDESSRLRQERDLYLRILQLGSQRSLDPFLDDALALFVEVTGAKQVYLELLAPGESDDAPRWCKAHSCSAQELERSRGIIDKTIATGKTVVTASARNDPDFQDRGSVQRGKIEAVLCAPIGTEPVLGVVYLQGRDSPGPFGARDREAAELLARHLAPFTEHLVVRAHADAASDPTRKAREKLRADDIIGRSEALAFVLSEAAIAAPLRDMNVLLTGDSGTGKTQLANVIHRNGPREAGPFVEVNVATLQENLVESELFGAERGAHSTATAATRGKVEAAQGGTLFLDEISELPPSAQAKILQLIQSKRYYPLGSSRPQQADVRIIAATNRNLEEDVKSGRFREDLFYRLEVMTIRMPSLRERRQDIPELCRGLCTRICETNHLPRLEVSPGAMRALEEAEWPGNIRQLENAIRRAVVRATAEGLGKIERRHLFRDADSGSAEEDPLTWQEATRRFHHDLLRKMLDECGGNVAEAARRLDLARSHVYNLIKALELEHRR